MEGEDEEEGEEEEMASDGMSKAKLLQQKKKQQQQQQRPDSPDSSVKIAKKLTAKEKRHFEITGGKTSEAIYCLSGPFHNKWNVWYLSHFM